MRLLFRLCLLLACLFAMPALGAQRLALVIGNNSYANLPANEQLQRAVNDAEAVGDALERLGFTVLRGTDLGRGAMLAKLSQLRQSLKPGDVAFVYFSGHGVAIDGANYLLPSDVPGTGDADVTTQSAVAETYVEGLLTRAGVATGVLVLDACRNNPFEGGGDKAIGGTKGLARAEPPSGVFKLYAAGTGETALDRLPGADDNPNSVFTRILLPELEKPENLVMMAYSVKAQVAKLAASVGHRQNPAQYDGGFGIEVYLAGKPALEAAAPREPPAPPPPVAGPLPATANPCGDAAAQYAEAKGIGTAEAFRVFLAANAACPPYADFAKLKIAALEAQPDKAPSPAVAGQGVAPSPGAPATAALNPDGTDLYDALQLGKTEPQSQKKSGAPETECDQLAASPDDSGRIASVPGVPFGQIDVDAALSACRSALERFADDPRLTFQLGRTLTVARRYGEARTEYEKARAGGHVAAMDGLGFLYSIGLGVARDHAKARELFEKAAGLGDAAAMQHLAGLYYNGLGVSKDYAEAREWYEKAASLDNSNAMYSLAIMHTKGQGVARDDVKAREWYEKAAELGNSSAMYQLAGLYSSGRGGTRDFAKTREWYEKAASFGNTNAMFDLGVLYANGQGGAKDYAKAREWFEKAAGLREVRSMYKLGASYFEGKGVEQDYAKAREWFEKAAALSSTDAMYALGFLYSDGLGVAQDYAKAREWYEKAASLFSAGAMLNLGSFYAKGQGVAQDYVKAREWYEKAAGLGNAKAMYSLGRLYDNGIGVVRNGAEAARWVEKALRKEDAITREQMKTNSQNWSLAFRKALQGRLRQAGVYDSVPDGNFGPATQRAIDAIFGKEA